MFGLLGIAFSSWLQLPRVAAYFKIAFCVALVILLQCSALCNADETPAVRKPVPDETEQHQAVGLVAEVYKSRYDSAKFPQQKDAFAKKLLEDGKATTDNSVSRFVLLRISRDIAAQVLDWKTAFEAVDELTKTYEVDEFDQKTTVLKTVEANSKQPKEFKSLLDGINTILDRAVAFRRFDICQTLSELATPNVKKSLGPTIGKSGEKREAESEAVSKAYADAAQAFAKLKVNPKEPQANTTTGEFLCVVRSKWDMGLPMLDVGSDARTQIARRKRVETTILNG